MSKPIHIIRWEDNFHQMRWHDPNAIDIGSAKITTVGFLVREDDAVVGIASTVCEDDGMSNFTQLILRSCILDHEIVDFAKKPRRKKR